MFYHNPTLPDSKTVSHGPWTRTNQLRPINFEDWSDMIIGFPSDVATKNDLRLCEICPMKRF